MSSIASSSAHGKSSRTFDGSPTRVNRRVPWREFMSACETSKSFEELARKVGCPLEGVMKTVANLNKAGANLRKLRAGWEAFITAWERAGCPREAAEMAGVAYTAATARASSYRRAGVQLKYFA